jgi:DNA-binding transcriptional ArsR family regulator
MVEYSNGELDRVFAAMSDPTRRTMLAALSGKPSTISELARPFPVSFNAISKHVLVLERAGLIRREVLGREHHLRLEAKPLRDAAAWLEHYREFWEVRLDALERHIVARRKRLKLSKGDESGSHGRKQTRGSKNDSRQPRRGVRRLD